MVLVLAGPVLVLVSGGPVLVLVLVSEGPVLVLVLVLTKRSCSGLDFKLNFSKPIRVCWISRELNCQSMSH